MKTKQKLKQLIEKKNLLLIKSVEQKAKSIRSNNSKPKSNDGKPCSYIKYMCPRLNT